MESPSIQEVKKKHEARLMALPGVVSVGIGRDRDGAHSIIIGLDGPRPEIEAQLVAEDIAEQLAKRASFRRCMKRAMETTMEAGAKGIKIQLAGRLGGSEMARCEKAIAGSIPLSTLRAKIDYGFTEAKTAQGHIGVQVWVNQGMYHEDETDGVDAQEGQAPKKPKRTYKR